MLMKSDFQQITWKNMPKMFVAGMAIGLCLLMGAQAYSQQNININGTVRGNGIPNTNPIPNVEVLATRVDNGDTVDLENTNINGFYNMDFIWTGTPNHETLENKLYPNPCNTERNIELNAISSDNYKLNIFDAKGQLLFSEDVYLKQGGNKITLNGGQAGIHFITLTNEKEKQTYKEIQMTSTSTPIQYTTTSTGTSNNMLKSTLDGILMLGDEVKLTYSKAGYVTTDTTFIVAPTQTVNKQMQQSPTVIDFVIKPYTLQGEPITSLTLDFLWNNNEVTQHSVESDGFIHVYREEFGDPTTTAIVTHNSDTATYSLWQFFRKTDHNMADTNYAQSPKEASVTGSYSPPQPTLLNIAGIPDTLELYLPKTQVEHPLYPGEYVRMDDPNTRHMMCSRDPYVSIKYIEVPAFGRKVVNFQFSWDDKYDPSHPWDPAELQLARETRDKVLSGFERANGKSAFPPDTSVVFTSTSDPYYQLLASQNWSQTAKTAFNTNYSIPSNGVIPTTSNSSNGENIIDKSYSRYPDLSVGDIFAEAWQQYTNGNDPLSGGGAGPWVRDATTGNLTPYGIETMLLIYTANQGSKLN